MQPKRTKKYNLLRTQSTATFLVGKTNGGVPYHKRKARCIEALVNAGKEDYVFVKRLQMNAAGMARKSKSRLTKLNRHTRQAHTWHELQRRWYTPWGERCHFKAIKADLLHFCSTHRRIYAGVASFGRPCGLRRYRKVLEKAIPAIRKFFAKLRERGHQVTLIYSVFEHRTRDDMGVLRHGSDGKLLYFIHVHFLVWAEDGQDLSKASWLGSFRKKFKGGIERIRSKKKLTHYVTKPLEVVDLLDAGEYVPWVEQVKGLSRYTLYKPVKECVAKRAKRGHKACFNSAGLPYIRKVCRRAPGAWRSKAAGSMVVPVNQKVRTMKRRHPEGFIYEEHIYRNVHCEDDLLDEVLGPAWDAEAVGPQVNSSQESTSKTPSLLTTLLAELFGPAFPGFSLPLLAEEKIKTNPPEPKMRGGVPSGEGPRVFGRLDPVGLCSRTALEILLEQLEVSAQ